MLVFEGTSVSYPTCSPDGNYLAFITTESIYVIRSDGTDLREIYTNNTSSPLFAEALSISNEGKVVVFTGGDPGGSGRLANVIINTETLESVILDTNLFNSIHHDISPDGSQISLFGGGGDIYIVTLDEVVLNRLTSPELLVRAVWSPDANILAITTGITGPQGGFHISLLDIDRLVQVPLTHLTNGQAVGIFSSWSPDGRQILFENNRPQEEDSRNLYVMNSDGSEQRSLTQFPLRVITSCFLTARPISLAVEMIENAPIPTVSP